MNEIEVFYPTGRKISEWVRSYEAGMVPDLWPYGLQRLGSGPGMTIKSTEAKPLNPISTAKSLVRKRTPSGGTKTALAWDEDLAIRLIVERPTERKFAGVIWATDRFLRRDESLKDVLLRQLLRKFEGLWTLSRAQIDSTGDWLGRYAPPIEFLKFGIDESFFTPSPYPDRPLILSLGRDRDRDPGTLLAAFEEVKRIRPDVDIAVQTTTTQPVPPGIRIIPMVSHHELRALYRRSSVVAVATRPNVHVSGMTVALESMASGRPIVISKTPGMEDYVEDGVTGRLVSPLQPASLASAVLELLDDPYAAAAMGTRGRKAVEAGHTSTQMTERLLRIIQPT